MTKLSRALRIEKHGFSGPPTPIVRLKPPIARAWWGLGNSRAGAGTVSVLFEVGNVVIRPAAKHCLEFVAGVMTVLVVGGLVFAFKIASGPTSLKFLAPTIAAVLSEQMGDFRVSVKTRSCIGRRSSTPSSCASPA